MNWQSSMLELKWREIRLIKNLLMRMYVYHKLEL